MYALPYDSAHYYKRMGAGPLRFVNNGLVEKLEFQGYDVVFKEISLESGFHSEIATSFQLLRRIREEVKEAILNGSLPIVLSGSCSGTAGEYLQR